MRLAAVVICTRAMLCHLTDVALSMRNVFGVGSQNYQGLLGVDR